jgi:dTDP-4-dehydrorhamnose reductase
MKVLITGGNGRLGSELKRVFPEAVAPDASEMDVTDETSVATFIAKARPDAVIHAAALTDAQECERDRRKAWDVNVNGTQNVLSEFRKAVPGGYFVYISTAGVFDCERGGYSESAVDFGPVNFYCLTKLCGEIVSSGTGDSLIIRTNFVQRGKWPHAKAFTDRFGTYLYTDDAAIAIKEVVDRRMTGVVHVCGDRKMSMHELAALSSKNVGRMSLGEYAGVPLPKDMSLVTERWHTYKLGFAKGDA